LGRLRRRGGLGRLGRLGRRRGRRRRAGASRDEHGRTGPGQREEAAAREGRSLHLVLSFSQPGNYSLVGVPAVRGGVTSPRSAGGIVPAASSTAPGDIGRRLIRTPIALWIALQSAAGGGTIGTSPTPRTP